MGETWGLMLCVLLGESAHCLIYQLHLLFSTPLLLQFKFAEQPFRKPSAAHPTHTHTRTHRQSHRRPHNHNYISMGTHTCLSIFLVAVLLCTSIGAPIDSQAVAPVGELQTSIHPWGDDRSVSLYRACVARCYRGSYGSHKRLQLAIRCRNKWCTIQRCASRNGC